MLFVIAAFVVVYESWLLYVLIVVPMCLIVGVLVIVVGVVFVFVVRCCCMSSFAVVGCYCVLSLAVAVVRRCWR